MILFNIIVNIFGLYIVFEYENLKCCMYVIFDELFVIVYMQIYIFVDINI